jgi:glycosyltransferase involved in cell wall biosynthesis
MISIVTGYYNRKGLFARTLLSISKSAYKDIEVIAVDDGSSPEHRLEDLTTEYPFLKVIRLEKENKWWINPCVTFNIGLRAAKGDIIVLQNPECLHVHDILSYFAENINDTNYISISAYGIDPPLTDELPKHIVDNTVDELVKSLPQVAYRGWTTLGWYNHSAHRPVHFHFCSAMSRNTMARLNGFDERFALGIGYDDDEIIVRLRKLGINLVIEDRISVIHQYHESSWNPPNAGQLCERNRQIVDNVTRREPHAYVNAMKLWNGI